MTKPTTEPPAGVVVIDKPAGWTSHDVVARTRRLAQTRKVGHAGTLDPMATGVLVVGVGRATRLLGYLSGADKEYLATIVLGASTITDDAEGEVTDTTDASAVTETKVLAELRPLTGQIMQVPSSVSAIKVDGKRSYARVRSGEEFELAARPVEVAEFELLAFRPGERAEADVRVVCSSGTYIRALARDLGKALGVGGHLSARRRTRVGGFGLTLAKTLAELEKQFGVVPIGEVAKASFESVELPGDEAANVRFGRRIDVRLSAEGPVAVFAPDGEFLALYEAAGDGARPVAVFT